MAFIDYILYEMNSSELFRHSLLDIFLHDDETTAIIYSNMFEWVQWLIGDEHLRFVEAKDFEIEKILVMDESKEQMLKFLSNISCVLYNQSKEHKNISKVF